MKTSKKRHEMTAEKWIDRSRLPSILDAINSDPYIKAWGVITRHFAKPHALSWDDVVIALHLAYSWMPTIPDLDRSFSLTACERSRIVSILNRVRSGGEIPSHEELILLKTYSNNSIVGASKLLHFIAPKYCPIWDKRVANVFYWHGLAEANQIERYETYRKELNEWLLQKDVQDRIAEMKRDIQVLEDAPAIRILELVLFSKIDT